MRPLKHLIIVIIILMPCIAQAQDDTTTKLQRLQQLIAENPYWICVKSFSKCTIKDGEIVNATNAEGRRRIGYKFHFDNSYYTQYHTSLDDKFTRKEFNDTLYDRGRTLKWDAHLQYISPLNDGSIVIKEKDAISINHNTYMIAMVLSPITKEQFEKTESTTSPTLEEYFYDAQPIPRNIKKILRKEECWIERYEHCELKDGVVRVLGFMVGGGRQTARKFTRGFKGEYYSIIDNSTGRNKIKKGKFQFHKDDFLYYLDGDIIYIPHENLATDGYISYYRLTPSKHSFEKTIQLLHNPYKERTEQKTRGFAKPNRYFPNSHK